MFLPRLFLPRLLLLDCFLARGLALRRLLFRLLRLLQGFETLCFETRLFPSSRCDPFGLHARARLAFGLLTRERDQLDLARLLRGVAIGFGFGFGFGCHPCNGVAAGWRWGGGLGCRRRDRRACWQRSRRRLAWNRGGWCRRRRDQRWRGSGRRRRQHDLQIARRQPPLFPREAQAGQPEDFPFHGNAQ